MRLLYVVALAALASRTAASQSKLQLDTAQVRQWREDIEFVRREAPARHANLFHDMTQGQFDSALTSIETRLPTLARHQVIVELQKVAAMIKDGHSNIGPWRDSLIAFHTLPVALYWFDDGLRVRAADSAHKSLLGARVTRIGSLDVDSAIARVTPLISRDNEMGIRAFAPFFLVMPEILHATGISAQPDEADMTFDVRGKSQTVKLRSSGLFPMLTGDADKSWLPRSGWVDARDAAPAPLWLSKGIDTYWYSYLPETKALYMEVNTIQQKSNDSLNVFMKRAIAAADSAGAERLVLDLRLNGGGNGSFNRQILLPLIKSQYDVPGRFYVLTGRRTWSAAQMLVTELMKYTNARFVGEPSASKGNHFGDSYRIVLPNSKVTFRVSTLWHQYLDSRDKREIIQPKIPVQLTFSDYAAGRDPILEAAMKAPLN
ncbi:MAG TPA: hypothetical protein VF042_00940 [Gemmatimonadaceae bacterium]